jgi:DNA-binding beta-propeller fold protein YncE
MTYYNYKNSTAITLVIIAMSIIISVGCGAPQWKSSGSVLLGDIAPIGLDISDGALWVSDGDHNKVVQMDMDGKIVTSYDSIERPMHLTIDGGKIYIPSYGTDQILIIDNNAIDTMDISIEMDAPGGVAVKNQHIAIADFYNNRIVTSNGSEWKSIGEKGKGQLEFNYPTDVHIYDNAIYVADAYNNRIQVLDLEGNFQSMIGEDQGMNAATGIFADGSGVYITDFENDRVLIFNHEGKVLQIISEGLNKPTDLIVSDGKLYISNYKGKYISIYEI